MKDYKEMAKSVLRRRDQYVARKRKQRKKIASALSCLCLAALVGVGVWHISSFSETPTLDDGVSSGQLDGDTSGRKSQEAHQQQDSGELNMPADQREADKAGLTAADIPDSRIDAGASFGIENVEVEAEGAASTPADIRIAEDKVTAVTNISRNTGDVGAAAEPVTNTSDDIEYTVAAAELTASLTFEEVIQESDAAIVGRYIETTVYGCYLEQKFSVINRIYGDVPDDEIYLFTYIGSSDTENEVYISGSHDLGPEHYVEGADYILIMGRDQSILYDHDRYTLTAPMHHILLNQSKGEYSMKSEPIEIPANTSMIDYIGSVYASVPHTASVSPVVFYESETAEMLGESRFVGIVNILELQNEGETHNGDVYRCSVDSLIAGDNLNTYDDNTFLLVILKNTVEVGRSYIIGFSSSSEQSLIYTQATPTSVYEVSDELLLEIAQLQANGQLVSNTPD